MSNLTSIFPAMLSDRKIIRQKFLRCLEKWPEAPVKKAVQFLRSIRNGGTTRHLISYEVEPGETIEAWLVMPKGCDPQDISLRLPAVLVSHPHYGIYAKGGKNLTVGLAPSAIRKSCSMATQLAETGFICLTPDLLSFGKRYRPGIATEIHVERVDAMKQTMLGRSMLTKHLHDLRIALNILECIPAVDASRLGAAGHSMGSTCSYYLTMVEPRIKATVCSAAFYSFELLATSRLVHCFANYVPGIIAEGIEMHDLYGLIAPRPFLMQAGRSDPGTPLAETKELHKNARRWWKTKPGAFRLSLYPGQHERNDAMIKEAASFLRRWL